MVQAIRLYGQPTGYYMKTVYKSIFPTSDANLDSKIGFYAKFCFRIHSTPTIPYDTRAAAKKNYYKKWHLISLLPLITSIKHYNNLI